MSTKRTKLNVRILAWILSILMVLGIAVLTVQMIIVNVQESKAAEEAAGQEQTEGEDHDHDHDHEH